MFCIAGFVIAIYRETILGIEPYDADGSLGSVGWIVPLLSIIPAAIYVAGTKFE